MVGDEIRKKIVDRLEEIGAEANYPANTDIVLGLHVRESVGKPYPEKGKIGELLFDAKDRSVWICTCVNQQFVWSRVV